VSTPLRVLDTYASAPKDTGATLMSLVDAQVSDLTHFVAYILFEMHVIFTSFKCSVGERKYSCD